MTHSPKRGDVHPETGRIFWDKNPNYTNGERWFTREMYEDAIVRARARSRKHAAKKREAARATRADAIAEEARLREVDADISASRTWRKGDVHPRTGLVFMSYARRCVNGEWWVTREHFDAVRAKDRERRTTPEAVAKKYSWQKRRLQTDPGYKAKRREQNKIWMAENYHERSIANCRKPEARARQRRYKNKRYSDDPAYRLMNRIRGRTRAAFQYRGVKKCALTEQILGCKPAIAKAWIERQFVDGMTWANAGKSWHVDHILPFATAKTAADIVALGHYTNLRPLFVTDNLTRPDDGSDLSSPWPRSGLPSVAQSVPSPAIEGA